MRKIWTFIKKVLKRLLPPTVHVFMREVNGLHGAMAAREANLSHQLGVAKKESEILMKLIEDQTARRIAEVGQAQGERLDRMEQEQGKRLDRLSDLFESANRENLRLFFDSREERREMDARYAQLAEEMKKLQARQEELEKKLAEHTGKLDNRVYNAEHSLQSEVQMTRQTLLRRQDEYLDPALYPHALKLWYWQKTGKVLDLENPKTFNEKIQWMKLYDNNPQKTKLADKLLVRDWVKEKIGEDHLIPLLGVWDRAEDIDYDTLPNQFVLKANHGSGWNIVVKDKAVLNIEETKRKLSAWMKTNFAFSNGFELHYLDIEPKILAEKYIESNGADQLFDYKFMCFDGDVDTIIVYTDRNTKLHRTFFTPTWERIQIEDQMYSPSPEIIPRPVTLDTMINIAKKLSKGFPHVRVDLYESEGQVYFGEMTFSTSSGVSWWSPEQETSWGSKFKLPIEGKTEKANGEGQ